MSETPPYFINPFAILGDVTAVPTTGSNSGPVNYQYGYGVNYELDLLTNPDALPIGRETFNQVLFDITTLLQQYSQYGVPLFITNAQNGGVDFPYPQYAQTFYMGNVYENQVASNTALPGTDATWARVSGGGIVPTGTILDFAGPAVPGGFLACDDAAVSRTTYAGLLSVITQIQTGTTTMSANTVSGLTSTAQMYVGMQIESANMSPGTSIASIVDANNITITPVATTGGATPITFFQWGNGDGSTTFNVPDMRRNVTIGQGGTPYAGAATVGQVNSAAVGFIGGQEAHTPTTPETAAHTHSYNTFSGSGSSLNGSSANVALTATTTGSTGGGQAFNVMQPTAIVYKIIKT